MSMVVRCREVFKLGGDWGLMWWRAGLMMVGERDDGLRDKQKKKPMIKSHVPWHGFTTCKIFIT